MMENQGQQASPTTETMTVVPFEYTIKEVVVMNPSHLAESKPAPSETEFHKKKVSPTLFHVVVIVITL